MGRKVRDIAGQTFGNLTVLHIDPTAPRGAGKNIKWVCSCLCGGATSVEVSNLIRGNIVGCGCLRGKARKYTTPEEAKKAAVLRAVRWNNANKTLSYQRINEWRLRNPGKHSQYVRRRHARKLNQTCACCTSQQLNDFYMKRPVGYEVDHVMPLARGGKHCVLNFQYLTVADNRRKGARLVAA